VAEAAAAATKEFQPILRARVELQERVRIKAQRLL
jgi:hypothetical protein